MKFPALTQFVLVSTPRVSTPRVLRCFFIGKRGFGRRSPPFQLGQDYGGKKRSHMHGRAINRSVLSSINFAVELSDPFFLLARDARTQNSSKHAPSGVSGPSSIPSNPSSPIIPPQRVLSRSTTRHLYVFELIDLIQACTQFKYSGRNSIENPYLA